MRAQICNKSVLVKAQATFVINKIILMERAPDNSFKEAGSTEPIVKGVKSMQNKRIRRMAGLLPCHGLKDLFFLEGRKLAADQRF